MQIRSLTQKYRVVQSGRYEDGGVLPTANPGQDGGRLTQEDNMCPRRSWPAPFLWYGAHKNSKVLLCTAYSRQDGRRYVDKMQNWRLREVYIVFNGRHKDGEVLHTVRSKRRGIETFDKIALFDVAGAGTREYCGLRTLRTKAKLMAATRSLRYWEEQERERRNIA